MVMADRNGIFKDIAIEPEFERFVYQVAKWQEEGHVIENYMSDKMGNIMFHFKSLEEKNEYMPRINELVHVVYQEER